MSIQAGVPSEYTRMTLVQIDQGKKAPEPVLLQEVCVCRGLYYKLLLNVSFWRSFSIPLTSLSVASKQLILSFFLYGEKI